MEKSSELGTLDASARNIIFSTSEKKFIIHAPGLL